jgi:hypothetical protein
MMRWEYPNSMRLMDASSKSFGGMDSLRSPSAAACYAATQRVGCSGPQATSRIPNWLASPPPARPVACHQAETPQALSIARSSASTVIGLTR